MTEAKWLACKDTVPMLHFLRGRTSDRKLLLFACATARYCLDATEHDTIAAIERVADGEGELVCRGLVRTIRSPWPGTYHDRPEPGADPFVSVGSVVMPDTAVGWVEESNQFYPIPVGGYGIVVGLAAKGDGPIEVDSPIVHLVSLPDRRWSRSVWAFFSTMLRDAVGNPFRPVAVSPAWRTDAAVGLAESAYADRAFDRLPILADALEDAGCDHPDVLAHCRGPGPHARGCWVVDLVLGKA